MSNVVNMHEWARKKKSGSVTSPTAMAAAYKAYLRGCQLDEDEGTLREAETQYRLAVDLDPEMANAWTNLGNVLYRRRLKREAETAWLEALRRDAGQPEARYNVGYSDYERGDYEGAIINFELSLASDPGFADAHYNLAQALVEAGQSGRAQQHWRAYVELEPHGTWANNARRHLKGR